MSQMMEVQRKNEMRWYAERQAVLQTQAKRAKSSAQARSILQSLTNGETTVPAQNGAVVDHEAEVRELADFDRKIYAAQVEIEGSMTAELKGLGVPFFGTEGDLVLKDEAQIAQRADGGGDRPKWSPVVTEAELLELRKRMIQHLEDLYRD